MSDARMPLKEIREEVNRVAENLDRRAAPLRLIGGAAIWLRCPSASQEGLRRNYADLDFIGLSSKTGEIKEFLTGLGYEPDKFFNSLHGRTRLLFWDTPNDRQVDVFLDEMKMCHRLDFRSRLTVDPYTLSIADLLLTKLQIIQLNPKDLTDLITLLIDHPVGEQDGEAINGAYIARLAAEDWGLYRTIQQSLERVQEVAPKFDGVGSFPTGEQAERLWKMIEAEPKTMKWKMRAAIGDRVQWYELPEEVRRK